MRCTTCAAELPKADAAISVFVIGDEYTYSYFRCPACGNYTVEGFHDRFMGESHVFLLPPIPASEGERAVALIRTCPEPGDKWCECEAHKALYTGRLGPGSR